MKQFKRNDKRKAHKLLFLAPLILMLALCSGGLAETWFRTGMVTDATETGFTLYTGDEMLRVVITEQTERDVEGEPENGDVVTVRSDGSVQNGLLYADGIALHKLSGVVEEITDGEEPYLLLMPLNGAEPIRVNLRNIPASKVAASMQAQVYYDGKQTRSVPPQITALYIRGTVLRGTVETVCDNGDLILRTDPEEKVLVHLTAKTLLLTTLEAGKTVLISVLPQMRLSMPPQYEAQDILPVN